VVKIALFSPLRKSRHGVDSMSVRIRGEDGVVTNTMEKKHDHGKVIFWIVHDHGDMIMDHGIVFFLEKNIFFGNMIME